MKKGSQKIWIIGVGVVYVFGLVVALAFRLGQSNPGDTINTAITVAFFILVLIIFGAAICSFLKGRKLSDKINAFTEKINELKNQGDTPDMILSKIRSGEVKFGEKVLDEKLENYKTDLEVMASVSNDTFVDIEYYFNNSLVDTQIHTHFLNQISGTMTGLGILGTFVGLSIGLNDFTLSGTSEDITNQIQPLMDGIKVAFHTSIFGLIYSIGFNFCYRQLLESYHNTVANFVSAYQQYVVRLADNGSESSMIKYQQKMIDCMERQYAEIARGNKSEEDYFYKMDKTLDGLTDSISVKLNQMMQEVIVPEITKMSVAVEEFAKSTQKEQTEELARIVDGFITSMNQSLGNSFTELGNIINETNEWQKNSLKEMQNVLNVVNHSTVELKDMETVINKAIQNVNAYTDEVKRMQDIVNANLNSLNVQIDLNNETIAAQTEKLSIVMNSQMEMIAGMTGVLTLAENQTVHLKEVNKEFADSLVQNAEQYSEEMKSNFNGCVEEVRHIVADIDAQTQQMYTTSHELSSQLVASTETFADEIKNKLIEYVGNLETMTSGVVEKLDEHIGNAASLDAKVCDNITQAAEKLASSAEQLDGHLEEKIKETFITFDKQLADITSHLVGVLQQMKNTTTSAKTSYDGISSDIQDKFEELQLKLEQYLEYTDKLHRDLAVKWEQYKYQTTEEANK